MTVDEELIQVEQIIERLLIRYPSAPPTDIELTVRTIHKRFADVRVHDFVPLLVEKAARQAISIQLAAGSSPRPTTRTRSRGAAVVTIG
ncbi:hypothetical protein AB0L57_11555 [Nocardia sp. NPDC052254]|uniref:three-helix bundle dimerization domain-containing protein n=1 Tax=Nocardia sp. NPDC052254 TaxID=3155681 RepID=UPI0034249D09